MRERPARTQCRIRIVRITPARVGKTYLKNKDCYVYKNHPRSCGKDQNFHPLINLYMGSPPLVRERRRDADLLRDDLGITPARTGKTSGSQTGKSRSQDHPRSCGKDHPFGVIPAAIRGSPPLVRERLLMSVPSASSIGITPARAGKTGCPIRRQCVGRDHPRSCGKDSFIAHQLLNPPGSPPLVRERLFAVCILFNDDGITPARAGKTASSARVNNSSRDHPRSCGKDWCWCYRCFGTSGSPPLVRERPKRKPSSKNCPRITPARAGKIKITLHMYIRN